MSWTFTYPANAATVNWTVAPKSWMAPREQWEYSHATGALLNLTAMIALILSLLPRRDTPTFTRTGGRA